MLLIKKMIVDGRDEWFDWFGGEKCWWIEEKKIVEKVVGGWEM